MGGSFCGIEATALMLVGRFKVLLHCLYIGYHDSEMRVDGFIHVSLEDRHKDLLSKPACCTPLSSLLHC